MSLEDRVERCLREDTVVDLIEQRLDRRALHEVKLHIAECASCRVAVAEVARGHFGGGDEVEKATRTIRRRPSRTFVEEMTTELITRKRTPMSEIATLPPGATVGRYVLLRVLGHGGMGVVYCAHDPQLDRRIALKLVRLEASGDEAMRSRLILEARTMAQLSDPNVVHVYDAGVFATQVFVAMELVPGVTLREWMREKKARNANETLDVLVAAGRGLAGAHRANIVHRDFKPENILIGFDGRVRVGDFGLARTAGEGPSPRVAYEGSPSSGARTTLAGTPAYMSPEQFMDMPLDARSDQFSFCVTLYEALCGERPFSGSTIAELTAEVTAGAYRDPPATVRVAPEIRRVILRGLHPDPNERHPSMDVLLEALEAARTSNAPASRARTASRWIAGIALLAGGLVVPVIRAPGPPAPLESPPPMAAPFESTLPIALPEIALPRDKARDAAALVETFGVSAKNEAAETARRTTKRASHRTRLKATARKPEAPPSEDEAVRTPSIRVDPNGLKGFDGD